MLIVEMFWGSSGTTTVYGLDKDGDLVPKKSLKNSEPTPDYRHMRCGGSKWSALLELGKQHGWQPMGTIPGEELKKGESFNNNYEPYGYYEFYKRVKAEDAENWADALNTALRKINEGNLVIGKVTEPNILSSGMSQEKFEKNTRKLDKAFLEEFIAFLRKGTFKFSWDD